MTPQTAVVAPVGPPTGPAATGSNAVVAALELVEGRREYGKLVASDYRDDHNDDKGRDNDAGGGSAGKTGGVRRGCRRRSPQFVRLT